MNNTVGASPISYDDTTRFNTETQLHCFLFFCFSIITQLNSKPVFFSFTSSRVILYTIFHRNDQPTNQSTWRQARNNTEVTMIPSVKRFNVGTMVTSGSTWTVYMVTMTRNETQWRSLWQLATWNVSVVSIYFWWHMFQITCLCPLKASHSSQTCTS